jgi:hypothetical protein
MKKSFTTIFGVVLLCWIAASFVDINLHNNPFSENYLQYSCWNVIEIIENIKELV